MKIREGFVSNSSTSSYQCKICDNVGGGPDTESPYSYGFIEFNCGHAFCSEHKELKKVEIEIIKSLTEEEISYYLNENVFEEGDDILTINFENFSLIENNEIFCPACKLDIVPNEVMHFYLLSKDPRSLEEICEEIRKEYTNYDGYKKIAKNVVCGR